MSDKAEKKLAALMFTDLVGSVALQQRLGTAAYMRYVARHDEIFQECLPEVASAQVLNETGDGFLVRFDDPGEALNSALRVQWRLHGETCQQERIRIRIGLHLGVVTEMEEGIRGKKRAVGMPINLTARIMELADGGQILMTRAFCEDVRHHVREHPPVPSGRPPALQWRSHGFYEFKGHFEPMEIFETGAEGIAPFLPPEGSGKGKRSSPGEAFPSHACAGNGMRESEVLPAGTVKNSDVFISYASVDDKPLARGQEGWVTQFHRNLEIRLEQLLGEPVKVWRNAGPRDPARLKQILSFLSEVKAMVSVLSPPFVRSDDCVREVVEFATGRTEEARIIKAEKTPLEAGEVPLHLSRVFSLSPLFTFYEVDPESGRVHEFDETYGDASRQRFFERIYDIAYELKRLLRRPADTAGTSAAEGGDAPRERKTVYLAETTSDLKGERDQLKRELLESGHRVLPEHPLPLTCAEMEDAVRKCLGEADLAVHFVGGRYGLIPEDASHSLIELQNIAGARAHEAAGLARIIWIPRDVRAHDERQTDFLKRLTEDPDAHRGAEVIQDTLENLSGIVLQKLARKPELEEAPAIAGAGPDAPSAVYLICDQRDEEAVEVIEDFLFDQGFEVITPHFDGDEAEVSRMHRENLLRCDGVLVYYGQASKTWVEMQMMDVVQAPGYGRSAPMRAQTVFVALPEDRRKARFRTHLGDVIRQESDAWDPGVLEPFTSKLQINGQGSHA